MELKTKYKYIVFNEEPTFCIRDKISYECQNYHGDILGIVEYCREWKRYIFAPNMNTEFSADCLQDIIHFIGQLK